MAVYCERADVENVFGVDNVAEWADLDNDANATTIENQITWAIAAAGDEIDDYMRGTRYRLPLQVLAGTTPTSVRDSAATIAGLKLYDRRGIEDDEGGGGLYGKMRARVYESLSDIRTGTRKLDAV